MFIYIYPIVKVFAHFVAVIKELQKRYPELDWLFEGDAMGFFNVNEASKLYSKRMGSIFVLLK